MKKILSLLLAAVMVLSFGACGKDNVNPGPVSADPVTEATDHDTEAEISFLGVMLGDKGIEEWNENNVICRAAWKKLKLSEKDEEKYPALKKTFQRLNEEALKEAKAAMYELSDAAEGQSGGEYDPLYLYNDSEIFMQRADSRLVSYVEEKYIYSGGIHPDYGYFASNIDPETGDEVILTDVMTSIKGLPDILEKKLSDKYDYINFAENQLWEIFQEYSPEDYQWTLDYQGITFWFSPYDIASYTAGAFSVKIYFDEEPHLFNEEYISAPSQDYVIMLPEMQRIDFDLSEEDGQKDWIEINQMVDDYGTYHMLSVTVNGQNTVDEINYAYDYDIYLVHTGGKSYIYSDSYSDNDYHMFCTWDLNGLMPKQISQLYATQMDYVYIEEGSEDGVVYQEMFYGPSSFSLVTRFDILGTRGAAAEYRASEKDGTPEMTEEAYTFRYGHDIKSAISLEAEVFPDMQTEMIPAGTTFSLLQTDGASWVDAEIDDGRRVRLAIDISDWPSTVNGIPEEECFEELFYAG